jgi:Putative GTPase activating protein for Arf
MFTGKEKEVLAMENGGNEKVNAVFEARLPQNSNTKPTNHADGPTRERFIRDKYERRKYYDAAGMNNVLQNGGPVSSHAGNASATSTTTTTSVGPPSDAAKQRLEQRRARIDKSSSTITPSVSAVSSNKSRLKVAKAPASAPPPQASVDLLGFDTTTPVVETSKASTAATDFDFFDFSSSTATTTTTNEISTNTNNSSTVNDQWNELTTKTLPQQPVKPAIDLTSLYNGGQTQQHPAMGFGNVHNMYNVGNNNAMMMNSGMVNRGNNHQMQQMNMAMQNMNFANNNHMTPQQMAYQQQMMIMQQQQQQQMMLLLQQQQQQSGMIQHQHQHQSHFPNAAMTQMNQFGSNNVAKAVSKIKSTTVPEKEDPFAQFGTNMFR